LSNVIIADGVLEIPPEAFRGCSRLTSITIPDGVTTIEYMAFQDCHSLTNVTIAQTVTNIGAYAFSRCFNLVGICFEGNAPRIGISEFSDATNSTVLYLPGATGWGITFAGRPTASWLPQMSVGDAGFGTHQFGFNVSWARDKAVVIEACSDLARPGWVPLQTNVLTGGFCFFSDPEGRNYPGRFYRVRSK
jgi:hypothetical protein